LIQAFSKEITTMKIHNRIYLQYYDDNGNTHDDVHWCEDRQFDGDIEYIRTTPLPIDDNCPINEKILVYEDASSSWRIHYLTENDIKEHILLGLTYWLPCPPKPE
jgi:hypothetical protein